MAVLDSFLTASAPLGERAPEERYATPNLAPDPIGKIGSGKTEESKA